MRATVGSMKQPIDFHLDAHDRAGRTMLTSIVGMDCTGASIRSAGTAVGKVGSLNERWWYARGAAVMPT